VSIATSLQDPSTLATLRETLEAAGYSERGLRATLGVDLVPLPERRDVPLHVRRLHAGGPLATLITLFLLSVPVTAKAAARALEPLSLESLEALGLLERRPRGVRARMRLVPYQGLILACDRLPDRRPPADWVDGVTRPANHLAALTVRRPIEAALDVGTGSGVQALLAARHARRVVATDVNPRALAFTALNARLNGLAHVECRLGDRFTPVAGETFDLVVSNPPYVISPEFRFLYRDSGGSADAFCRDLVRRAPRFLREGGFAHILCNWVHRPDEDWWTPVRRWVGGQGFDAWLLRYRSDDPLGYAAIWNAPLARTRPDGYARTLDRWLAYYRRRGISAIASGAILIRRRAAARNWIRADDYPADVLGAAGDQILRTFEAQDHLAAIRDDRRLLREPYQLADTHRLEHALGNPEEGVATRGAVLWLDEALVFRTEVSALTLRVLARCDGRPVGALIDEVARTVGTSARRLRATVLPEVRRLVRLGVLVRMKPADPT
jgi:hypothetical protein